MSAFSLAVLASGRGSNLQALLDAIAAGALPARIAGVFSDKPACNALAIARAAGLHAVAHRLAKAQHLRLHLQHLGQHQQLVLRGNGLATQPARGRLERHGAPPVVRIEHIQQHAGPWLQPGRFHGVAQALGEFELVFHGPNASFRSRLQSTSCCMLNSLVD